MTFIKAFGRVLVLGILTVVANVYAESQWCAGIVKAVIVYGDGQVTVRTDWRNDFITICNLSSSRGSVSTQTCRGYLSLVQQAIAMNRKTTFYYNSAPACAVIPTYNNAPSADYVLLDSE